MRRAAHFNTGAGSSRDHLGLTVAMHLAGHADPDALLSELLAEKRYVDETLRRIYLTGHSASSLR
ncbi:MAG: hypothetical protein AB7P76_03840 [Candidatus Melainabacteria bacterium]